MEVVTADGRFVTANEKSNPDLFWALRGGGGSTYGVVTSVVIRSYPRLPVTTMTFSFATGGPVSTDRFWAGVRAYFGRLAEYADAGTYGRFAIGGLTGEYVFEMLPWFAPGMTRTGLEALAAPLLADLADLVDLVGPPVYREFDDFYDAWDASFPLEPWGSNLGRSGSRLFPRASWENATALELTFDAVRYVVDQGGSVAGLAVSAGPPGAGHPDNAVNPAWRETVLHAVSQVVWERDSSTEIVEFMSYILTFDWIKTWRQVSPGAGA